MDSFFDITFTIEFQGLPGGALDLSDPPVKVTIRERLERGGIIPTPSALLAGVFGFGVMGVMRRKR